MCLACVVSEWVIFYTISCKQSKKKKSTKQKERDTSQPNQNGQITTPSCSYLSVAPAVRRCELQENTDQLKLREHKKGSREA